MQLRQAVDGRVEELRVRVLEAVPARVVGRVAQPEVGPQVDDRGAGLGHRRHAPGGDAVGEGEEDRVRLRQLGPDGQPGRGQVRVVTADRLVLAVPTGQPDDRHVRVAAQQPDQLRPDVPGRADDADPDPAHAVVPDDPAFRAGHEPRRPVRRDHRGRLESRAHGHRVARSGATSLTGDRLGWLAGIGWTVVMGRMTIQADA